MAEDTTSSGLERDQNHIDAQASVLIHDAAQRVLQKRSTDKNDYQMLLRAISNQHHAVVLDVLASLLRGIESNIFSVLRNGRNTGNSNFHQKSKCYLAKLKAMEVYFELVEDVNRRFEKSRESQFKIYLDEKEGQAILSIIESSNGNVKVQRPFLLYLIKCIQYRAACILFQCELFHTTYTDLFRDYALEATLHIMERNASNRELQCMGINLLHRVACIFITETVNDVVQDARAFDLVLVAMFNFDQDAEIQKACLHCLVASYFLRAHTDQIPANMNNCTEIAEHLFHLLRLHNTNRDIQNKAILALCDVFKHNSDQTLDNPNWIPWLPSTISVMLQNNEFIDIYSSLLDIMLQTDREKVSRAIVDAGGLPVIFHGIQQHVLVQASSGREQNIVVQASSGREQHIVNVVNILVGTRHDLVFDTISQTDGLLVDIITANLRYRKNGWDPAMLLLAQIKNNADGRLPLHYLVSFSDDESYPTSNLLTMVEGFTSEYREGCRSCDNHGNLPLHLAIKTNTSTDVVRALLNADSDTTTILDGDGNLSIELACPWNIFELIHDATPPSLRNGEVTVGVFPPPIKAALNNCDLSNIYILLRQNMSSLVQSKLNQSVNCRVSTNDGPSRKRARIVK